MHPLAVVQDHIARPDGTDLVILGPNHAVHRLDAVAAWIWQHADGERSVDALLMGLRAEVDANADRELVFEALDRLADAALLQARIAPPSGVSRRVALHRLFGAGALAALSSVVARIPETEAAEGGICADDKSLIEEIAWLEAEQGAIADILDDWVEEGEKADDTSEVYLGQLRLRERSRKRLRVRYRTALEDANDDLGECLLDETSGKSIAARSKRRSLLLKIRREKATKRRLKSKERTNKRTHRLIKREHQSKAKLLNKEFLAKKKKKKAWQQQLSKEKMAKKQQATKLRLKAALGRQESHEKQNEAQYKERLEQLAVQAEREKKHSGARLVRAEQRKKLRADAFTSRQTEASWKKAGADDGVLAQAQKDALVAQEQASKIEAGQADDAASAAELAADAATGDAQKSAEFPGK